MGDKSAPELLPLWLFGTIGVIFGVFVTASSDDAAPFGFIIIGIAGVAVQVAVIATAVSLGMRHRDAIIRESEQPSSLT